LRKTFLFSLLVVWQVNQCSSLQSAHLLWINYWHLTWEFKLFFYSRLHRYSNLIRSFKDVNLISIILSCLTSKQHLSFISRTIKLNCNFVATTVKNSDVIDLRAYGDNSSKKLRHHFLWEMYCKIDMDLFVFFSKKFCCKNFET
jgi:hypothetical protein